MFLGVLSAIALAVGGTAFVADVASQDEIRMVDQDKVQVVEMASVENTQVFGGSALDGTH